ncbi:hypothetical protein BDN71DRAFT_1442057 [Pleurotus eryngii]|uniref:Uncharacterized protein n=1 Tax=Pleurotus eryngii TaxID=5323 RepID=A0A9P6DC77_PLEER|nr:hypothetical protein BDN71DRAFT_1442057 [Pleurotus eryngii]
MMHTGELAVAIVQRKVMIVRAKRTHNKFDRWLEVDTYTLFGDRVFLATDVPTARIQSSDVLTIFPTTDVFRQPDQGMLELPQQAFSEYLELSMRTQKRYESMWSAWAAVH